MLVIREAVPEDACAIRQIQYETWLDTYVNTEFNITPEDIESKQFTSVDKVSSLADSIANKGKFKFFVAELDGEIVGWCSVKKEDPENYQSGIYILSKYQHQGIGKALTKKAYNYLGPENPIICEVASYNTQGIHFWESLGFKKVGESKFTFPTGKSFPLIKMKKE